ncbi:hypothetical protein LCGC14_2187200 [marine sediment metagenome]|uniref:Uncharacterized protein n=1 Tax=marine sediment metagenome TaxID=412755 RepID=A0A0F9DKS3_9ZZZZ
MKIKFTAHAVKWFDKVNGNTYHSVRITRTRDGKQIVCQYQYGYGDQYRQTALEAMAENKWIPVKYRGNHKSTGINKSYLYERENNYPIEWIATDGLKRECIANGTA